jgi:hypothetical protein
MNIVLSGERMSRQYEKCYWDFQDLEGAASTIWLDLNQEEIYTESVVNEELKEQMG